MFEGFQLMIFCY